jgi:hypothetical protein
MLMRLLVELLWKEPEAGGGATSTSLSTSIKLEVEAPNRRDLEPCFFRSCSHGVLHEEEKVLAAPCSEALRDRGVCVCTLEASSSCGVHQRRQRYAGVIFGDSSHSTPGSDGLPWTAFLLVYRPYWRIFIAYSTGFITYVAPSGMFPGGCAGSRSWRFTGCGGKNQGSDCFSPLSSRVLSVKVKAHAVFLYVLRGLSTTLYRPLD